MSAVSIIDDAELFAERSGDPRVVAAHYARAGLRVFPVRLTPDNKATDKQPPRGYMWKVRATSNVAHVVQDVDDACAEYGDENIAIAWALGLDGYVALDLDAEEAPEWWAELEAGAAVNHTRRGRHLVSPFPDDVVPGNGAGRFPSTGWGEVRGHGGYIVIAGPDRPGFDERQLDGLAPFPHAEWLTPEGDLSEAATSAEVVAFVDRHAARNGPFALTGVTRFLEGWTPGGDRPDGRHYKASRHDTAVDVACWIAREAAEGLYPASEGFDALRSWWHDAMADDSRRRNGRELDSAIAWAIGQVPPQRPDNVDANGVIAPDADPQADTETDPQPEDDPLVSESFQPVDLGAVLDGDYVQPVPTILKRDDRQALIYPGQVNELHGDSGVGKGWTTLYAIDQQLRAGRVVMLVDAEDIASSIVARLRILGTPDAAIRERLVYIRPTDSFTVWNVDHLLELIAERDPSLVVLDSLGECFGLDGVNEDRDNEVGPWLRRVARRLADAGPAVLLIDHSTKSNDNPLHPSGSKRKRAAVGGASYLVMAMTPLSAANGGRLRLKCAKDRHGNFRTGQIVGDLVMTVDAVGTRVEFYAPDDTADETDLPILLAARAAVRAAKAEGGKLSQSALLNLMEIKARADVKRGGVDLAAKRGALVEAKGPRNSRLFEYVRDLPEVVA